jgi:hypothetical protein
MSKRKPGAKRQPVAIPRHVRRQANEIVYNFNAQVLKGRDYFYVTEYRAGYLYLYRFRYGTPDPICRLKYRGGLTNWDFAIFKYSTGRYDPDEPFFPGAQYVDGTLEGAMKAGLEAYPASDFNRAGLLGRILSFLVALWRHRG